MTLITAKKELNTYLMTKLRKRKKTASSQPHFEKFSFGTFSQFVDKIHI